MHGFQNNLAQLLLVLVNRLGGLSLPRESAVRLTDRPDMTLDVYRGRKTTTQHQQLLSLYHSDTDHVLINPFFIAFYIHRKRRLIGCDIRVYLQCISSTLS